jgi:hypothetical protein
VASTKAFNGLVVWAWAGKATKTVAIKKAATDLIFNTAAPLHTSFN